MDRHALSPFRQLFGNFSEGSRSLSGPRVLNALEVRFAVDTLVAAVGLLGLELQLPSLTSQALSTR
jgi:hypothetical protein